MPAVKRDMKIEKPKIAKGKKLATKSKTTEADSVKGEVPLEKADSSTRKRGGEIMHENGDGVTAHEVPETSNGDGPKITPTVTKGKRAKKKAAMPKEALVAEDATSSLPKERAKPSRKRTATIKGTTDEISQEDPANDVAPKAVKTAKAKVTKKAAKAEVKKGEEEEPQENIVEEPKAKRGRAKKVIEPPITVETGAPEVVPKKKSRKQIATDDKLEKPVKKVVPKAKAVGKGTKKTVIEALKENVAVDTVLKTSNNEETVSSVVAEVAEAPEEVKPITAKATKAKTTAKGKGANKKVAAVHPAENTNADNGEEKLKQSALEKELKEKEEKDKIKPRKRAAKTTNDEKIAKVPKNSTTTVYDKESFALAANSDGEQRQFNLKISSWNVAGLRSWVKKEGLKYLDYEEPDILCLQEIKCAKDELPDEAARLPGYHPYWLCKPGGYAGVAIYSKIMPIHVEYGINDEEFDKNGRIITAEYEKFYLVNVYVPNSGRHLVNLEARMRWEQLFLAHVKRLDKLKAVIICGDMNVSHEEIDLANPKSNTRNAGFTVEEREKMTQLLSSDFVDTFRHLYPERTGAYTFWSYMGNARSRNVGWRLDYFIASKRFMPRVVDNVIRSQCKGSDHCPITLFLNV